MSPSDQKTPEPPAYETVEGFSDETSHPPLRLDMHITHDPQVTSVPTMEVPIMQRDFKSYRLAIPLGALATLPLPVDCPVCQMREVTEVKHVSGAFTHGIGVLFCLTTGLGCIPYCADRFKNVEHRCGACHTLLVTWKRSGSIIIHAPL